MPSSGVQTCALDRKSTRLNSSHTIISYAVFYLKKDTAGELGRALHDVAAAPARTGRRGARASGQFRPPSTRRKSGSRSSARSSSSLIFNDPATTEIYTLSLHDALPINDTATTEIYTLSLHDALPISVVAVS